MSSKSELCFFWLHHLALLWFLQAKKNQNKNRANWNNTSTQWSPDTGAWKSRPSCTESSFFVCFSPPFAQYQSSFCLSFYLSKMTDKSFRIMVPEGENDVGEELTR